MAVLTSPEPARSADLAASIAAPAIPSEPAAIMIRPQSPLCISLFRLPIIFWTVFSVIILAILKSSHYISPGSELGNFDASRRVLTHSVRGAGLRIFRMRSARFPAHAPRWKSFSLNPLLWTPPMWCCSPMPAYPSAVFPVAARSP